MRNALRKLHLLIGYLLWSIDPASGTNYFIWFYRRQGMIINGTPNYISATVWFDGSDYSLIELGDGCTISSNVRILTHDWSPTTAARGLGLMGQGDKPIGILKQVKIGAYAFVGTGSILLPGAQIGTCSIVGAGTVVRGQVPDYTVVSGNPASVVGDTREYCQRKLKQLAS